MESIEDEKNFKVNIPNIMCKNIPCNENEIIDVCRTCKEQCGELV